MPASADLDGHISRPAQRFGHGGSAAADRHMPTSFPPPAGNVGKRPVAGTDDQMVDSGDLQLLSRLADQHPIRTVAAPFAFQRPKPEIRVGQDVGQPAVGQTVHRQAAQIPGKEPDSRLVAEHRLHQLPRCWQRRPREVLNVEQMKRTAGRAACRLDAEPWRAGRQQNQLRSPVCRPV